MSFNQNLLPKNVKSVKSSKNMNAVQPESSFQSNKRITKTQSHFLVSPDKLDKVTKRIIAPYAQIERKGLKEEESKEGKYLDINRFTVFLEDTVDLDSLLYETAMVLKTISNSSGVFVYIVNQANNEIVMLPHNVKNPARHEINIPICEGKVAAAHVAFTKEYLLLDDVPRDRRFAEGLKWIDAKVALCMPIVKPDGECYAVLELYRTYEEPYDNKVVYTAICVSCWAGAAVHQAQARITLQKSSLLNVELLMLLQRYFCDLASFDTMITDMLAVVKSFLQSMRSSFFIIDTEHSGEGLVADMWDDGWSSEKTTMPRRRIKVNFSHENTPASMCVETGKPLNLIDAYRDTRFAREVDPTTGTVVRTVLVNPIIDKNGVIGVVQLTNKMDGKPYNSEDQEIFNVFVKYCSLIVHFSRMHQKMIYNKNLNEVFSAMMAAHLKPCRHDFDELMDTGGIVQPPSNFKNFDYHISEGNREDIPGLITYMFADLFPEIKFEVDKMANFALTIVSCYRKNPYHNAEHAFCFTHTMYVILSNNVECLTNVEKIALMLAGFCHDLDHPGYNNNFLKLIKHPLSQMYKSSTLEHHHYFLARKIVLDKKIISHMSLQEQNIILEEMKYNILCTDLAVYFQIRAQLTPVITGVGFDWTDVGHRNMLKELYNELELSLDLDTYGDSYCFWRSKGILMTTCDLSGCCKQFGVSKAIALTVYEEFYDQGDQERELGYTPLSMMDRKRSANQPAEQIQFISVVVLPCLMILQSIMPNTIQLIDNARKTKECWHEEIEVRGLKLWRQSDSIATNSQPPEKSDTDM